MLIEAYKQALIDMWPFLLFAAIATILTIIFMPADAPEKQPKPKKHKYGGDSIDSYPECIRNILRGNK